MKFSSCFCCSSFLLLVIVIESAHPTCVLESDYGFKINCAFKKSGLFRVRNLGGVKAHASIGFSLGDDLGFDQSFANLDQSRRRSVSVKNGSPNVVPETSRSDVKQEKRGRIMMRPPAPPSRPSQAAMDKLTSLHRRASTTMRSIIIGVPTAVKKQVPSITMAKPVPMGVPPFRPLPPKEDTLSVIPLAVSTKKTYTPLQYPQSKGPGLAYQNPVPHKVHDLASIYATGTKKIDDYNSITGYEDDTVLKFNKDDLNEKIVEIAKAGNISMEAVEAAIALRQQQLLNKYANFAVPTPSSTTSTTQAPAIFQPEPEPEIVAPVTQKPKRIPNTGKVMNAPREYYPVGYEKNFDDHFQSKVDLPDTNFYCGDQKYFPGLYGDESLGCMVFHVCALTDDGLVMKSFLCPESTLFDQTILKCNWWFYVDCKSTKRLYETNIPVSKSYQLMKALTFFTSYNEDNQNGEVPSSEPDVAGIKKAISILENQNNEENNKTFETLQIVTPFPLVDERNNHKMDALNETSPIYRETRNYKNSTTGKPANTETKSAESIEIIAVNTNSNVNNGDIFKNSDVNVDTTERKHRRTMTLKQSGSTLASSTTLKPIETTTPAFEIIKQEIQPIEYFNNTEIRQETLQDQIDLVDPSISIDAANSPIKRFYRSSAEKDFSNEDIPSNKIQEEKSEAQNEVIIVNNEKVQIVRPTPISKLVGDYLTPTATALRLDEAVLGNSRHKKHIFIVTPQTFQSSLGKDQR